jgi:hypothetical protein
MGKKQKAILRTQAEKDALKTTVGRPSKYDPSVVDKFIQYFSKKPYEKNDITGREVPADFPTLAGFAISIGISRDTLHEWAQQYPEFSDAYKRAKEFQENYLVVNGLKGLIQQPMAIFTSKNLINWTDKQEIKHEGQIDSKISVEKVDIEERVKALKGKE